MALGFGGVGFIDDFLKVTRQHHRGLPGGIKLGIEVLLALGAIFWILSLLPVELASALATPFFKDLLLDLGCFLFHLPYLC